ncbi:MAG: DUF2141 domain-containing protein [Zetaproteobacteria bacterium]|nr:DUF2141 domain-containing protein [Zetaproteobacteria bacterium]
MFREISGTGLLALFVSLLVQCGPIQVSSQDLDIGPEVKEEAISHVSNSTELQISFKVELDRGGDLCVAVFDSMTEYEKSGNSSYKPATVYQSCDSVNIGELRLQLPAGREYAIVEFHDENQNGKLDTWGRLGIPTEGFGFSNNPPLRRGRPSWDEVKFFLGQDPLHLEIVNTYL